MFLGDEYIIIKNGKTKSEKGGKEGRDKIEVKERETRLL